MYSTPRQRPTRTKLVYATWPEPIPVMEALLQQSGIAYHTPGGEQFASLQHSYTGAHSDSPLSIITLPETSEQVATIVKQSLATSSTIVVRGGGHDCFGRFAVKGAVSIDLRNLDFVSVAEDKKTARVGGGVKATKVLGELAKAGLQVPVGACGDVGFTSWCMIGGFGPYSSEYGIGSDQIVGARVVNAEGEVVDADERLLKGLRGGGGSLAIVTELIVKTYPLKEVSQLNLINLDEYWLTVYRFKPASLFMITQTSPRPFQPSSQTIALSKPNTPSSRNSYA